MVKWMSTFKKKDLKGSGELFSLVCSTTAMKGLKTLALKNPTHLQDFTVPKQETNQAVCSIFLV